MTCPCANLRKAVAVDKNAYIGIEEGQAKSKSFCLAMPIKQIITYMIEL